MTGFMLDELTEMLASAEASGVFNCTFEFTDDDHAQAIQGVSSEDLLAWMKVNGYSDQAFEVFYKSICKALAYDLLEFVGAAVRATMDDTLTVALALLRKPFKENLFYIEWILADSDDFFEKFEAGDVDALELRKVEPTRKLEVIRSAMTASPYSRWIEPEFIYELRFDKQSEVGLEPTWQRASHLITTKGARVRTEAENFNFVFSGDTERHSQIRGFYATVPLLLFHAVNMIEAMIHMFARREKPDLVPLRKLAGMDLWMGSRSSVLELSDVCYRLHWVVARTLRTLRCARCDTRARVNSRNLIRVFRKAEVACHRCSYRTPLDSGE
ncbi:MAG TPA: hypothetical protein VEK57_17250 [Thermoanaerobaculia bacterium]|nr:hypothetical protein [Thermoanaerobaculia bacterium]